MWGARSMAQCSILGTAEIDAVGLWGGGEDVGRTKAVVHASVYLIR